MDIGAFAHALGIVVCRPALGDLDLTPWSMHVDTDEEIDGAVAAALAFVTFELSRGRDGLAHLTDEHYRLVRYTGEPPTAVVRAISSLTSSLTIAISRPIIPNEAAAKYEMSTTRPGTNGPRSLTRTITDRPVATSVTRNRTPNGKLGAANGRSSDTLMAEKAERLC